jgi:hypothetical protein
MQRDKELIMSDAQAVTVTAASTDVIDRGAKGDLDEDLWLVLRSGTAFTADGAGTMQCDLEVADNEAFNSNKQVLFSTGVLGKAAYALNTEVARVRLPVGKRRFMRMNYTVATGPMTAGTIDAFLVADVRIGSY